MRQLVEDVAAFHRRIGLTSMHSSLSLEGEPALSQSNGGRGEGDDARLSPAILRRRLAFIDEEAREVREALAEAIGLAEVRGLAMDAPEVAHLVQELIDLAYVVAGTFAELGIDPGPAWDAVHQANLRKVGAPDGGKAVKPEGWEPPVVPVVPLRTAAHAGVGGAGRA